ncbi:MAG: ARMT1-like domain-containing protein [Coriobacteriia bacterium]|nr:ARMT1-like domain-containing protein [Coriobacteriia bacterium]
MESALDCVPCLLRQALEATRMATDDPTIQDSVMRALLLLLAEMDPGETPPRMAQRVHHYVRDSTGTADPYRESKTYQNRVASTMLPRLRNLLATAPDPLDVALRLAIAGNVIDLGLQTHLAESDIQITLDKALHEPLSGDPHLFKRLTEDAETILYLADNAGEIVFDRLLVEQLGPEKTTVVVRGAPVLNDATLADARTTGLIDIVRVIGNGSDAPGTVLADCSDEFRTLFSRADLVIAKGQGNYESLSDEQRPVYFLFRVKCPVIASHVGLPMGTNALVHSEFRPSEAD